MALYTIAVFKETNLMPWERTKATLGLLWPCPPVLGQAELNWWITNVDTSHKRISHGEPELLIQTDASTHDWGGVRREHRTGGRWNQQEAFFHINYLELLAVLLTLKALCGECANLHIRVQCDNTTAVCYINNMGGSKSPDCNSVTRQIWDYCIERNIWLSASHLPGCENTEADRESRHFNDRTEWKLESKIYHSITKRFVQPSIDLFASRLNKQCPVYASWRPDPDALFVYAFSANWSNFFFYAFPPFSLIGKCLEKIQANKAEGILVVPLWTYQSWYPKLLRLLVAPPLMITHRVPETSPSEEKVESVSMSFMRRLYKNRGFSERATNIVLQSWRQSSQKQYDAHIRKWLLFCTKRQADPICPTISMAVDFLTTLYDEGLSYSSINSAN